MPAPLSVPSAGNHRWLVLAVQLPAHPSNARVKTWRRLQELGAVAVKHAVYVLPNSAQALEDFSWLRVEVSGLGGHAALFAASSVDRGDDDDIVSQFKRAREGDYTTLLSDIRRVKPDAARARSGTLMKEFRTLRSRADQLQAIDFHVSPVREVALVGPDREPLERIVRSQFRPHVVLAGGEADGVPLLEGREPVDGRAAAYVCERFMCQRPVTTPEELAELLS